jgi:hypothetical protein
MRIEDEGAVPAACAASPVRVGFSLNGEEMRHAMAPVGQDMELNITLDRGGMNVLHFVLDPAEGELTAATTRRWCRSTASATGCACCWSRASRIPASAPGATC